jgi:class 3 adenylate cyclase/tetratricopeptide (TPR) repeat protein
MRCSNCGSENPADRKFCGECGARFLLRCPQCGKENVPPYRFCGECGAALDHADGKKVEAAAPPRTPASGERRHLTVLFCDLVGSTEIAAQLDPEEWRDVVGGYHRSAAEVITLFGGHVAKYLGDGVMAYFGWPVAHENDGERAACAGLAIVERVSKPNQAPMKPTISVRVGIDSGTVVVGAGAGRDADVFGETPNIAARVQSVAIPGSVLITGATHRLLFGQFVVENVGSQQLKGVASQVELYRVVRPTGVRSRIGVRGLTPFLGREEELHLLLRRWELAREGEGQAVFVVGEPGIGKSRLVSEFHNRIRDVPHIWMESGGEQLFENTPFHAIIEMLSRWLELQNAEDTEQQFDRIERALVSGGIKVADTAPLIGEMLQLPVGQRYSASTFSAEQKRRRLLAALSKWVLGIARVQPVVLVIEDLHWLDPSTLELLHLLSEQSVMVPLMLLYTARPEFRAPWPMHTHHSQITLSRLSSRDVREMVAKVAARNALTNETMEAVVARTGGVPLFVEELTRAMLEEGSARMTGREIPATLHDSLMARLDRLGPAKEIIQIGAAIGGEFSYALLRAVHPIPDEDLQGAIHSATDSELIYARGLPPDAIYRFKHALIRDAAYEALLKSKRQQLHSRIAQVIDEHFQGTFDTQPELIAHHYAQAGMPMRAVPYWHQAGQRAGQQGANAEAVSHVTTGLELLTKLPDTPARTQQELALLLSLGGLVTATKGFAAPEVEHIYRRARALCEQLGDQDKVFTALFGLTLYYSMRVEHATAKALADQMLDIAQDTQDPDLLLAAHRIQGSTRLWIGEFVAAHAHLESGMRLYDLTQHRAQTLRYGQDLGVACRLLAHQVLWILGYPDQALMRAQEALEISKKFHHVNTLGYGLACLPQVHYVRGEWNAAQKRAEDVVTFATDAGLPTLSRRCPSFGVQRWLRKGITKKA